MNIIPSIEIKDINIDKCYFNPGCAMSIYKPDLVELMLRILNEHFGGIKLHNVCCQHNPNLPEGSTIINNCAGCDRRFRSVYPGIQTISFWEILDSIKHLDLPNYEGLTVSVHDSCSFRQKPQVHIAVRNILQKMNIKIIESEFSGMKSVCCGDDYYGKISNDKVAILQKNRASQMPCDDVVVYCIGCVRSMTVGEKQPHYLVDLIFNKKTKLMTNTLDEYHNDLKEYIVKH